MRCEKACEMMSLRLDGRLLPAELAELDGHVAGCGECREEWRRLQAIDAVLSAASAAAAPARLRGDVLARLNRGKRIRQGLFGGAGLALGSAVLAAVVAVPAGLGALELLGIAPALIGGLPETAAHVLPSLGSIGHAATLVVGELLVPLAFVGLCCLAVVLAANVVWVCALRKLRATR